MNKLLEQAYDPESFRKQAHETVDIVADYLEEALHYKEQNVFKVFNPDELYDAWQMRISKSSPHNFSDWVKKVMSDSIHLHNPGYMGHQVSPVLPQAALVDFVSALLNNGMGVYEMGSPAVAMERVVIKHLAEQIGFGDEADGVLTSGGTLGNLTAMLTARQVMAGGDAWNDGSKDQQFGMMVSEQAHYSIARAAKMLGWGERGIVKVPVDGQFRLDASKLETSFKEASKKGIHIIGVVGSACSTATGAFDPLADIAAFCKKHKLWFHVDGAHGGAAMYSKKHMPLLKGIQQADSVIMDFHKMLMCPSLVTGLVFKNGRHSYQTFAQKAAYLWEQENEEWFNLGKRTFECTKDMMALKVYSILQQYGTDLFKENVERLFDLGETFGELIEHHPKFELLIRPSCNIVCFRHIADDSEDLNRHNKDMRKKLLEREKYYIVHTNIDDATYLRTSLMNPFTTKEQLQHLLEELDNISV